MPREYADGMLDVVLSVRFNRTERLITLLMESAQRYRADAQVAPEGSFRDDALALEHIAAELRRAHARRAHFLTICGEH